MENEKKEPVENSTITGDAGGVTDDQGYEEVTIYYHRPSGYYYDPRIGQYLVPVCKQTTPTIGLASHPHNVATPITSCDSTLASPSQQAVDGDVTLTSQSSSLTHGDTDVVITSQSSSLTHGDTDVVITSQSSSLTHGGSVSDMLSAVSERVMQRWQDHDNNHEQVQLNHDYQLFYDKDLQLYFDPRNGCYYEYSRDKGEYVFHSQVPPVVTPHIEGREVRERRPVIIISSDSEPGLLLMKNWPGDDVGFKTRYVLSTLALIGSIAAVRDLGEPDTPLPSIEALRFNTRSPSGWILLVTLIALPLEILILIVRFLNFPVVNKYSVIWIVIDIFINFVFAIFFFGGAVPLGRDVTEWAVWRSRGTDMENIMYGLYRIVPSVGAEAAFAFLASFVFVANGVWMVIFLIMNWNKNIDQYIINPKTIETKKMSNSEADINPVTAEDEEKSEGQLQFTEESVSDNNN